jgi:hypothetical protein
MSKEDRNSANPPHDRDLRNNPGIGQSAGTFATGEDVEAIEGDNTVEGDIDNDAGAGGGVGTRTEGGRR